MHKLSIILFFFMSLVACGPSKEEMEKQEKERLKATPKTVSKYLKTLESTNDYQIDVITVDGKSMMVYTTRCGMTSQPL